LDICWCSSPGFGISLVAETTSGCFISADNAVSHARDDDSSSLADDAKRDLMPPEDIGVGTANALLGEIAQSGVVDSTHQVSMSAVSFSPFNVSVSSDGYWSLKT